ncbi:MAG: ABC transporter permease [Dehalococcoidales bacterium]|nr:ABC transporter permease [Dehalococcoidales bacterium]
MGSYIIRRLLQMIPVVILVTMMVFMLLHLTVDPIALLMGGGESLDPEQVAALRAEYGFDKPLIIQYFTWMGHTLTGDLGRSHKTQRPVIDELKDRLPVTLEIGLFSWLFSIIIAIPAGILSAVKRGSIADIAATVITVGGLAVPGFWLGTMLILLFAVQLRWLPPFGFVSVFSNPIEGLKTIALPVISLGVSAAALNMRQIRSSMLEVLVQDYVRTARAKGLKESRVIWLHALKNASLPVITLMGMQIGRLAGGAVVIENLFAIPGMGRLMVTSILASDFPVVQACVLITALMVLFSNLVTDIVYGYVDPRIRYS